MRQRKFKKRANIFRATGYRIQKEIVYNSYTIYSNTPYTHLYGYEKIFIYMVSTRYRNVFKINNSKRERKKPMTFFLYIIQHTQQVFLHFFVFYMFSIYEPEVLLYYTLSSLSSSSSSLARTHQTNQYKEVEKKIENKNLHN